jgi:hypothetical protein
VLVVFEERLAAVGVLAFFALGAARARAVEAMLLSPNQGCRAFSLAKLFDARTRAGEHATHLFGVHEAMAGDGRDHVEIAPPNVDATGA